MLIMKMHQLKYRECQSGLKKELYIVYNNSTFNIKT